MTDPVPSPFRVQPGAPDVQRHAKTSCPYCGKTLDAAGTTSGKPGPSPRTGDFAICFGCLRPAVYEVSAAGVALRAATAQEHTECVAANAEAIERMRQAKAMERRAFGGGT